MIARVVFAMLLFAVATVAQADVFKWVDDKGKTHFSDHPPTAGKDASHLQVLHGIAKDIQGKIRGAAPPGIDIHRISGDGRDCDISGEAESHATLLGFIERLRLAGIGETRTLPGDSKGPARGAEVFVLHLVLNTALAELSKGQP